jgi:hypothetical protein
MKLDLYPFGIQEYHSIIDIYITRNGTQSKTDLRRSELLAEQVTFIRR